MKERTADATWEMLALKFIINYSEFTAANRALVGFIYTFSYSLSSTGSILE